MKDIIPLGFNCGITFSLQALQIKKETSLFEWFRSDSLSTITKIINSIQENIDDSIIIKKDNLVGYFDINSDIYSVHYSLDEFKEIFSRRARRFLEKIKSVENILFIRIEDLEFIKSSIVEDLEDFKQSILKINPKIEIKFLLIDIIDKETKFIIKELNFLTHVSFGKEKKVDDILSKDPIFYEFLKEQLENLDCNTNKNNLFFYDKSPI